MAQLEQIAINELQLEHGRLCRRRRLKLPTPQIEFIDSDSRWGVYQSEFNAIRLSRKLLFQYPWHHVHGIFLHEVAHQLVAWQIANGSKTGKGYAQNLPHGVLFQDACEKLGVPYLYRRATVEFDANLDQDVLVAAHPIIEKVKKLMALAQSANENEAQLAMERVQHLFAKYNLEQQDLLENQGFAHRFIYLGKQKSTAWERRATGILLEHFFVRVILVPVFDPMANRNLLTIELIGRPENVTMAEYVFRFLMNQTEALLRQKQKMDPTMKGKNKTWYRLGVLDGFDSRLKAPKVVTDPSNNVVHRALLAFEQDPKLQNYVSTIYPRLGSARSVFVRFGDAYSDGQSAGQKLVLHKPIEHKQGGVGKIGPRFLSGE